MERNSRGRVIAKMMMVIISVEVVILSVSLVVAADDHEAYQPNSQVLVSLAFKFNSSEDNFKAIHSISHPIATIGSRILQKGKEIIGLRKSSSPIPDDSEKETSEKANETDLVGVTCGFHLVKGNSTPFNLSMKDFAVADTRKIGKRVVGVFGLFDGFYHDEIPIYLQSHLLENIITRPNFWLDPVTATREAYLMTNTRFMVPKTYMDASTAVTATLLMNNQGGQLSYKLVVANVGSSRAIICCNNGEARQLSVDHILENKMERKKVRRRCGIVMRGPRNELCISGIFPLTRAFGGWCFKNKISCEPDIVEEMINDQTEFLVLVSRPLWEMMSNQEIVDFIRHRNNARQAAQLLIQHALSLPNSCGKDDMSCLIVRFSNK